MNIVPCHATLRCGVRRAFPPTPQIRLTQSLKLPVANRSINRFDRFVAHCRLRSLNPPAAGGPKQCTDENAAKPPVYA
jgi:hypothetical protein